MKYKLLERVIENFLRVSMEYDRDEAIDNVERAIKTYAIDRTVLKNEIRDLLANNNREEFVDYLINLGFFYKYFNSDPFYAKSYFDYIFWDIIYPERKFTDDDRIDLVLEVEGVLGNNKNKGNWLTGRELVKELNTYSDRDWKHYHLFYFRQDMYAFEFLCKSKFLFESDEIDFIFCIS